MFRKVLFWLHFSAGLAAGLIIFLMALTGIILAFEPQIVAHYEADYRQIQAPSADGPMPLTQLLARAQASSADKEITAVTLWPSAKRTVLVQMGRSDQAWIDPYSGANLGAGALGLRSFFRIVMGLHRWLGLSESMRGPGRWLTGACNLAFVFLCASGLYLWWPRRWSLNFLKSVALFRPGLKGKARHFNWHNVIGLWSLPVLLVLSLSGAVISYPWASKLLYSLSGSPLPAERERGPGRPEASERPKNTGGEAVQAKQKRREQGKRDRSMQTNSPQGEGGASQAEAKPEIAYDAILAQIKQADKDWQKLTLRLPRRAGEPLKAQVYRQDSARPSDRRTYSFAPQSVALLEVESYGEQSTGQKLRSWVRPLHTGEAGGIAGQLLAALGSAAALFLVWTGIMLAWYRLFKRQNR